MTETRISSGIVDRLGREKEVELIASLLVEQGKTRQDHSFVLALDSVYGAGKSFFLDLLAERLSDRHPVARVDAWADDAGDEPTVAIMAAIEEALAPYLDKTTASDKIESLNAARRNIAPILTAGVGGLVSKAIGRYLGELAAEQIDEYLQPGTDQESIEGKAAGDALEAGFEEANRKLTELADRHARAQIADYLKRRKSRVAFKRSMAGLVGRLSRGTDGIESPLIVIIDELDRCRPDYALKVLEATKHFFDIPGVAFLLAIHKSQLIEIVRTVYGAEFEAREYLQRFFDLTIELQPRDMRKFVNYYVEFLELPWQRMRCPPDGHDFVNTRDEVEIYIAKIFECMATTAREGIAVLRGINLFFETWDPEVPVELTCLVPRIVQRVRGLGEPYGRDFQRPIHINGSQWTTGSHYETMLFSTLYESFQRVPNNALINTVREIHAGPGAAYVAQVLQEELSILQKRQGEAPWTVPPSLIHSYPERLRLIDRLKD